MKIILLCVFNLEKINVSVALIKIMREIAMANQGEPGLAIFIGSMNYRMEQILLERGIFSPR